MRTCKKQIMNRNRSVYRRLALLLLFGLLIPSLRAQDFKQALLKMQKEYGAAGRMHIIMVIKAFEKKSATIPFYNQKAEIKKDNQDYFYQLGVNDMLLNEKYLLMIDHSAKQITCNKNNLKAMGGFKDPFKMNLDSLLSAYGKSSYVGKVDNMEQYRIVHSKGIIKQTDMYFSSQTNLLNKIEYSYQSNQWVVIDFELFDKQPEFTVGTFDEARYMTFVNGKPKATKDYQQYEVIDVESNN
jgi:hypothetical protein